MSTAARDRVDVIVAEGVWGGAFDKLAGELAIVRLDPVVSAAELATSAARARGLIVRNRTVVDRDLLNGCPSLAIVGRAGVGVDNIDVAAANEFGVVVSVPSGANAISVAEHTLGLALALARRIVPLDRAARAGVWERTAGRELCGRRWGILGFGATGRAVARLARAFGMTVCAHDPYADVTDLPEGVELCSLEQVAATSDVLSIHVSSDEGSRHLVGRRIFDLLPTGAIVINVARGDAVDESALLDALASGRLIGAALDVRELEPPRPGPIEARDDVVLTPHVAGITDESQQRIVDILASDVRAVLTGGSARHAVGLNRPARR